MIKIINIAAIIAPAIKSSVESLNVHRIFLHGFVLYQTKLISPEEVESILTTQLKLKRYKFAVSIAIYLSLKLSSHKVIGIRPLAPVQNRVFNAT